MTTSSSDNSNSVSSTALYLRLLTYIKPYLAFFVFSVMGFLLFAAMQVLTADVLQFLVDAFGGSKQISAGIISGIINHFTDLSNTDLVNLFVVFAFFIIAMLRGLGFLVGNYCMSVVGSRGVHDLRCTVFNHMLVLPSSYFDQNASGHLVSRITFNVQQVQGAITRALTTAIREGATVIGLVIYLFYTNWQLTLTFVAVAPFIALVVTYVSKRFRRLSHRLQNTMGNVTHITTETISANREMRIFGGRDYESSRFVNASDNNTTQVLKMAFTSSAFTPIIQMLVAGALGLLLWLCLEAQKTNPMSAGQFVAFIGAAALVAKPLRQLSGILNEVQQGLAAAQDIFEVLDMPAEVDRGQYHIDRVKGDIHFDDVWFSYENTGDHSEAVLQGITVDIKAGNTVALVGSSGSGKTTLVSLLARFYDPQKGRILIDGKAIDDFKLANLRDQLALVNQQVTLFNDTIAHNIAYGGLAGASDEQIIAAAKLANAHNFIIEQPQGYETIVGDNGVSLSGGQRQRIAIARALLKDAPILILDEATSALDNESERLIQSALDNAIKGRTTFVIAHRLSTIENADMILVMERGKLVESGTHQELLDKGGRYSQLHQNQFSDS